MNAWATSYRLHLTPRLPCLFGCKAEDRMSHYVTCPGLSGLVLSACPFVPACPLARLGLLDTNKDVLLSVAASFEGYHAVSRHAKTFKINTKLDILPMHMVTELQGVFLEAIWAASLTSKFECKRIRPPKTLELADEVFDHEQPDLELLNRVFFLHTFFPDNDPPVGNAATGGESDILPR